MATDYNLDITGDLVIENGDFSRTNAEQQSVILVLNTNLGAWKWAPFTGLGIKQYKGATGVNLKIRREMIVQLEADGYKVNQIIVKDYDDFYLDIKRPNND